MSLQIAPLREDHLEDAAALVSARYKASRAWRAAEIPSSNGHTTAGALARIYGTLAHGETLDGVHLLHPATVDAAITEW